MEKIKLEFVPYKEFAIKYHKEQDRIWNDNRYYLFIQDNNLTSKETNRDSLFNPKNFSQTFNCNNSHGEYSLDLTYNINKNSFSIDKLCSDGINHISLTKEEIIRLYHMIDFYESKRPKISKNKYHMMIQSINGEVESEIDDRFYYMSLLKKYVIFDLTKMPYQYFLKTTYWEIIRKKSLFYANNTCQLCEEKNKIMHVHHRNYRIRGKETNPIFFDNGLIVLCEECHAKFHDKLEE